MTVEKTRVKIENQKLATSKRAAIEGTNLMIKKAQSVDILSVRGIVKSILDIVPTLITHDFRQLT